MSTDSWPSPYDMPVAHRVALHYVGEHYPELGVDRSQKMAWAIARSIQELQVLPLLMNLSAVSQALDLLGIPAAARTKEHPDIIDQMSARLPYLLERAFPADAGVVLHELLDEADLSRVDALGRTLTISERVKSGVDELLIWRGLAAERAAAADVRSDAAPTELIVLDPTSQLSIDELTMALADQMVPTMVYEPVITARVEQILSRLVVVAADQGKLRQEVSQLHRLVTDRLGKDKQLQRQIEQGFIRIESKISLIERTANTAHQLSDRQHADSRQQIASLEQQIVGLRQQIVALTKAVGEPRIDTAEMLLREALGGSEAAETVREFNQHADRFETAEVVGESDAPEGVNTQADLRAAIKAAAETGEDDFNWVFARFHRNPFTTAQILSAVDDYYDDDESLNQAIRKHIADGTPTQEFVRDIYSRFVDGSPETLERIDNALQMKGA